jgi:hypothetical protein
MDSIGDINFKTVSVKVVAGDMPFSMTGSISHGGILPVGTQRFTIDYYLYDFYQNPMANKSIWINTNLSGETTPQLYTSDDNGLIRFYYGPKISILAAKITAVTQNNASVTNELIANFVSNDIPTNLILVVTPETMASRETDPSTVREARVLGILTDDFGNPINGQDITFTISDITTAPYNTTGSPSFESGSLVKSSTTDSYGNAIITFYPGSFVTEGEDGYSNSATGSCKISATSGSLTSNPVIVEWKNFAYLSVSVDAQPRTVLVNETIDVTIKVTGDGYKMVHNPITVMLDMDTTSNLNAVAAGDKESVGGNGLKRFPNSKIAAKSFVGSLSSQDQLGLVTYGYYPNSQYWELITNVSYNHNQVNTSIESLEESGGLNVSIRDSIHEAVTRITSNPTRPVEEVAAIITIGDSSYKAQDFAPMVKETWTDNHIRVYSILYVSSLNNCDGNYAQDLTALTNATHGKFYCNDNLEDVIESFADIKQNLSTLAGVNTSMDLDFEHVTVDSNPMDGNDVFSYVVVDNGMTSPDSRTTILWPNQTRSFENQTDDWNDDFHLNFTIGTIHIKESWETTFRYKVKKEGIIDLFGPGSTISYNGGTGNLKLPTTLITSINNTIPQGLQSGTLSITNLVPKSGNYTDCVPMQWNLNYTGFDTVTEKYWYSYNNQPWVEFGSIPNIPSTNGMEILRSSDLDVTKFPPGKYRLMVTAQVPGIPLEMDDSGAFIKPGADPKINIRLK